MGTAPSTVAVDTQMPLGARVQRCCLLGRPTAVTMQQAVAMLLLLLASKQPALLHSRQQRPAAMLYPVLLPIETAPCTAIKTLTTALAADTQASPDNHPLLKDALPGLSGSAPKQVRTSLTTGWLTDSCAPVPTQQKRQLTGGCTATSMHSRQTGDGAGGSAALASPCQPWELGNTAHTAAQLIRPPHSDQHNQQTRPIP